MPIENYEFLGVPAVIASPVMVSLMEKIRRYAPTNGAVLIEGESGTGKEVVARALHHYSSRRAQPWVDVSSAALPEHLVESELFGHEKGAFSGADSLKHGLFELAHRGTLFLDEIGELEPKLQVKLLRVLDCHEYYRVGGVRKISVDVRIVTATNQNLQQAVAEGRFRKDLYHRLAQLRLTVPPLRERPEDILPAADLFRRRFSIAARFSSEVQKIFLLYPWPGNVRELRNAVLACGAAVEHDEVLPEHLPPEITRACGPVRELTDQLMGLAESVAGAAGEDDSSGGLLEVAERMLIARALEKTNGHHERAARLLGISSRTLSRKLKSGQTPGELPLPAVVEAASS